MSDTDTVKLEYHNHIVAEQITRINALRDTVTETADRNTELEAENKALKEENAQFCGFDDYAEQQAALTKEEL